MKLLLFLTLCALSPCLTYSSQEKTTDDIVLDTFTAKAKALFHTIACSNEFGDKLKKEFDETLEKLSDTYKETFNQERKKILGPLMITHETIHTLPIKR